MQEDRNLQIEAMKLRRRMAQAKIPHRLPKRPTEVEQRMADTAVDMLLLIQLLPYIRARPRLKPRRSRAKHRPNRLQRRRSRQAKRKTRK